MADSETGSHWQQIGGECFEGPLKGKRLTMVPFLFTTWAGDEFRDTGAEKEILLMREEEVLAVLEG